MCLTTTSTSQPGILVGCFSNHLQSTVSSASRRTRRFCLVPTHNETSSATVPRLAERRPGCGPSPSLALVLGSWLAYCTATRYMSFARPVVRALGSAVVYRVPWAGACTRIRSGSERAIYLSYIINSISVVSLYALGCSVWPSLISTA